MPLFQTPLLKDLSITQEFPCREFIVVQFPFNNIFLLLTVYPHIRRSLLLLISICYLPLTRKDICIVNIERSFPCTL